MPETAAAKITGVCARAPDANRLAAITSLFAIAVGVVGWFTAGLYAVPIAVLLCAALVLATHSPQPIEIGTDGLAFIGRRGSFVSFAQIAAIEEVDGAALLHFTDGRRLRLLSVTKVGLEPQMIHRLRSLALPHWQETSAPIVLPPRAGSTIAQWFESLRTRAYHRKLLLASVENAAHSPVLRATSALLLRSRLSCEERARIANAARATVAAPLRAALELVAGTSATETAILAQIDGLFARERTPLWRAIRGELENELPRALAACESWLRSGERLVASAVEARVTRS